MFKVYHVSQVYYLLAVNTYYLHSITYSLVIASHWLLIKFYNVSPSYYLFIAAGYLGLEVVPTVLCT